LQGSNRSIEPKFATIAAGVLAVIIYGSLFPFDFYANANPAGPFGALISTYATPGGRGDVLANILLYVPLGFFSVLAFHSRPRLAHVLLAISAGLVLSTSIELMQFYDRGRESGLSDVYANTGGMGLGAVAGVILHRKFPLRAIGPTKDHPFVLLMLACWLGYRLYPYVPTIDLHKYWQSVKPLLFTPSLPALDLYRHTVVWLAIALLFEVLAGKARGMLVFILFIPTVLFARILVIDVGLSPAEVAGGIMAALAWVALLSRLRIRAVLIAVMFAGVVILQALEPFHFSAAAHPFGWIPFRGFLGGSIAVNVPSFFEKAFTYGMLTWLFGRAGGSLRTATLLGGVLVLCLRLGQVYIPGRSAEITDVVMLIILAAMMKLMSQGPSGGSAAATTREHEESLRERFQSLPQGQ
jgi:VanZ family protein